MALVETGNLSQLTYGAESVFGTQSSAAGAILPVTSISLSPEVSNYIDDPTFRRDNMRGAGRRGALRGKGSFGGKMRYGAFDEFLAASLGLFSWSSNVAKVKDIDVSSSASVTVSSSGKTFTRAAGSWLTDGFAVGDAVQWAGFTNAANNSATTITTLTATVMTCSGATLVDESSVTTARCATCIRPSFTFERGHLANGIFLPFLGGVIDGFTISGKVNDAIDISFDVLTKSVGTRTTTSAFASPAAANTNPLLTSWDGSLKRNGTALASVVGWTIKNARNSDTAEVVGTSALYDIQPKAAQITGSLELYFDGVQSLDDFVNETDLALQLNLGPGVSKSYTLDLTKCRYKNWKGDPKDGLSTVSVDFESFAPDSGTNTSLMITRIP